MKQKGAELVVAVLKEAELKIQKIRENRPNPYPLEDAAEEDSALRFIRRVLNLAQLLEKAEGCEGAIKWTLSGALVYGVSD